LIELPSTDSPAKGALIVLHGWGANQHDLVPFVQNLGLKGTHSFFPDGLFDVPGTGGVGRGWFSFPLNENSERERMKSREMLFSLVNDVQKKDLHQKRLFLWVFLKVLGCVWM
tara:strand:- start:727 stop:1065 length:339 start_codon:yes stop_codon:yes gene_type:complete